jgi:hypothetical protein
MALASNDDTGDSDIKEITTSRAEPPSYGKRTDHGSRFVT